MNPNGRATRAGNSQQALVHRWGRSRGSAEISLPVEPLLAATAASRGASAARLAAKSWPCAFRTMGAHFEWTTSSLCRTRLHLAAVRRASSVIEKHTLLGRPPSPVK